ncbi:hypothetical protein [Burkholderia multivorans]|uniref:hypothetical protein n=1 Tax=Burkholderia multivorans TaxID=87883 RepID=UPI001906EA0A|nr:hypothetical protein [Burkholderia multivorans]MBJ9625740.1 hypothetical protein [Burkholderia multivorans]
MLEVVGIARNKKFLRCPMLATQEDQRAKGHDKIGFPVEIIAWVLYWKQIAFEISRALCCAGQPRDLVPSS